MSRVLRVAAPAALAGGLSTTSGGTRRLRWWHELAFAAVFYAVYSVIRNTQGSAKVSFAHAMENAKDIIGLEQVLGLYHERAVQEAFLDNRPFIEFWNLFYGTFHFIVTIFALVWLFRRFPERYRRYRNALACTTGLALIGFALYPLLPPRLMPSSYGFVDTLRTYGSLWSFDSGAMHQISNQYAAMPSLHFAWALWSTLALLPVLRHGWAKALAVLYPFLTLFAIVVTANHFVLDAAGGVVVLAVGMAAGFALATRRQARPGRTTEAVDGEVSIDGDVPAGADGGPAPAPRTAAAPGGATAAPVAAGPGPGSPALSGRSGPGADARSAAGE